MANKVSLLTLRPSDVVGDAAGCWSGNSLDNEDWDEAVPASSESSSDVPKIERLRDLERNCSTTNSDDVELWRCLAIAAARAINPPPEDSYVAELFESELDGWRQALKQLDQFRHQVRQRWEYAGCDLGELQDAAELVAVDEINLVFSKLFQEEEDDDMATATKSRRVTKKPTPVELAPPLPATPFDPESPAAQLQRKYSTTPSPPATAGLRIIETTDLPLSQLQQSPYQTRDEPDAAWLQEMAQTLQADGQATPALVRRVGTSYELIAGHTRKAAAELLGWKTLRCQVCECDNATAARLVYIENAKRRELTPIEKAKGLIRLQAEYEAAGKTQQHLADDVGMARSTVSNTLRLLKLPEALQDRVAAGDITIEQARSLATWSDRDKAMTAFLKGLETRGLREGPIEKHHFEAALYAALKSISKIMSKHSWGESCQFTPSAADKEALDIHEVPSGHGKEKRAFNVSLWKKLQDAANQKAKEKQAAKLAEGPSEKAGRDKWSFQQQLKKCWIRAYRAALVQTCVKLTKSEMEIVARLGMLCYDNSDTDDICVKPRELLAMSPAEYIAHLVDVVRMALATPIVSDWQTGCFSLEELRALAGRLGESDPVPHFLPSELLLKACSKGDIESIGKEIQPVRHISEPGNILAAWPAGAVPSIFELSEVEADEPDDDDC